MISRKFFTSSTVILLHVFLTTGCGFFCYSEHCHDWQSSETRTCRAEVKLRNIEFPVKVEFKVMGPSTIFVYDPVYWNENKLNQQRPSNDGSIESQLRDFGIACQSNLFPDMTVRNFPVEEISDSICQLNFMDKLQTQYELSWNALSKKAKAVVSTNTVEGETTEMSVLNDTERNELMVRTFETGERPLIFAELPVQVQYQQTEKNGYDASSSSNSGRRYQIHCDVTNLQGQSGSYYSGVHRESVNPIIFEETCSLSDYRGLSGHHIDIIPTGHGITVKAFDSEENVIDEASVDVCY